MVDNTGLNREIRSKITEKWFYGSMNVMREIENAEYYIKGKRNARKICSSTDCTTSNDETLIIENERNTLIMGTNRQEKSSAAKS